VTVTPAIASLLAGATLQFTATLKDSAGNMLTGRSVTWASSAPAAATVSPVGFVTGLATGAATITATSEGQSGSAALSVSGQTPLYTLGNGANYYVAPTGSDANPCTAAAPCYTLGRVSQLMGPGDNAHVAPGNYTWSYSSNRVSKSGTATAPISYVSDTKWGAKIYGADCSPITNDGAYVQIINFDVTGSCVQGITTNGSYSKIIGNRVHDMPGTQLTAAIVGDCCSYSSTGIQIIGNVVDNIGPWGQVNQTHGIYVASANAVVENNIVTRAASACIQTYHGATHLIISNNVVANCGRYGIQISADATVTINDYTTVNNNIIVNGGQYGIHEGYSLGSHIVYNNNIVYNNPAGNISGTTGVQSGTITLTSAQFSTLFVHYTGDMNGDYHLQKGAVAIDAGTTVCVASVSLCVPTLDLDGLIRPRGAAYDIGAYEY
jgi:Bacterial Ig-like domain (group 2)/Right handed beta helix region